MATIRQRESGYWQSIIRRKGHPDESKTFRTKTEAEDWARNVESDIKRGIYQSASEAERTTFSDLAKRFTEEFAPKHYRQREDKKEAWRFQCAQLEDFFGEYALAAIDQKLVARFRDERIEPPAGSKRKSVKESTVRKEIFMLSKILGFAQKECGILLPRGNPVEKVRVPTEGKARDRRLTEDEWIRLEREINKSRNPYLKPAFGLAVETAMRQAELLSLTWPTIDKKRRLAMLLNPGKIKAKEARPEPRPVPLSSRALGIIESLPRPIDGGQLLPVNRMTLYHAFIAACTRAGIENYTWHDLRHEALSRLAERGDFDILEMAQISGHKTLQMLKRYTHLRAERLAQKLG